LTALQCTLYITMQSICQTFCFWAPIKHVLVYFDSHMHSGWCIVHCICQLLRSSVRLFCYANCNANKVHANFSGYSIHCKIFIRTAQKKIPWLLEWMLEIQGNCVLIVIQYRVKYGKALAAVRYKKMCIFANVTNLMYVYGLQLSCWLHIAKVCVNDVVTRNLMLNCLFSSIEIYVLVRSRSWDWKIDWKQCGFLGFLNQTTPKVHIFKGL